LHLEDHFLHFNLPSRRRVTGWGRPCRKLVTAGGYGQPYL
jgi:hypothetical protein